ncbi:N-acetylglutaminylglutamine amidotransferase [Hyphobacterium marinum]|uniref:asparagine synthase (glutamine-hydrolyzing) n=1 Tax=Hyphobacterium marinum TaxID=3116574 RepID=A0ABU7LUV0_9PROT|nr:N-acetylglutaminylglutamine amidotransferase [Hyphobacterium sp. Y6023]MEE2565333.1 N-acetylglutaminylglutamine amidotransferase [Hyphobacterium sp. Y6023]
MCGIAGDLSFTSNPSSVEALMRMSDCLSPRGPDGKGLVFRGSAGLAHRRLKIIDLSEAGRQPMEDAELGLTLVFNGCIYNHRELRGELEGKGYRFFSTSDSEVILKGFHAWGTKVVDRLNGMFAFAIVERDSGRVTLARDRLGIKPLYLADTPDGLRFASSLPALLASGDDIDRTIDPVALHHYFSFHAVVPPPRTLFAGVRKLPPATVLEIEPDGQRREQHYWSPHYAPRDDETSLSDTDWRERIEAALRASVKRRLVADVPVGVLLSGGLDSSLIVALLAEAGATGLNTFSIGFETVGEEKGDEFEYSDIVADAFGTTHHKIPVETSQALPALSGAIQAMSEPMTSHDCVGFYLLSQEVSKHVKVVQSGQGADEVFAGYHWYPPMDGANDAFDTYAQSFFDRDHAEMGDVLHAAHIGEDHAAAYVRAHFEEAGAIDAVNKALRIDTHVMLVDDPVKRVDNMTMAWGLEARVPFLDHELVELAARCPARLKLAEDGKGILKTIARDHVPHAVIDRPKGYFPVPALKYLRGPYLEMVRDAVTSSAFRDRGLIQPGYIDQLLADPEGQITRLRGSKLWQVGVLALWLAEHDAPARARARAA